MTINNARATRHRLASVALDLDPNGNTEYRRGMVELIANATCYQAEDYDAARYDVEAMLDGEVALDASSDASVEAALAREAIARAEFLRAIVGREPVQTVEHARDTLLMGMDGSAVDEFDPENVSRFVAVVNRLLARLAEAQVNADLDATVARIQARKA